MGTASRYSFISSFGYPHAFLYSNGRMTDLGTLLGSCCSSGSGINAIGEVTGNSNHAFLYSNGRMADLGTLVGTCCSTGSSINNLGQVVRACFIRTQPYFSRVPIYQWTDG